MAPNPDSDRAERRDEHQQEFASAGCLASGSGTGCSASAAANHCECHLHLRRRRGDGKRRYSVFGEIRYDSGTMTTDYLYTGQRQEAEVGLYYYVARWYDPAIGRFVQADSVVPDPGSALGYDRYAYALNSPLMYVDPSGHFPWLVVIGLIIVFTQIPSDVNRNVYEGGCETHGCGNQEVMNLGWTLIGIGLVNEIIKLSENEAEPETGLGGNSSDSLEDELVSPEYDPPIAPETYDYSDPPGPDWEWGGPEDVGQWHNPNTRENVRMHWADKDHGTHLDWRDPDRKYWRIYPDGTIEPK